MAFGYTRGEALPQYNTATGQSCGSCHVNPAGGGSLTAQGQAFAAIGSHASDPAGAWAQASGTAPAPAAPAAPSAIQATVDATLLDDGTATFAITLKNSSTSDVADIYVAGTIPSGASLVDATATPSGAIFMGQQGEAAAWIFPTVPAGGSAGPFTYKVDKGSATKLAAHAFIHWLSPSDGTVLSKDVTALSTMEKLVNRKFNTYSGDLGLWKIQPGTAPRMMQLTDHFNQMWFAAQKGNWLFAEFEVYRSDETVKAIPVTRPAREAAMNAWWKPAQAELEKAIEAEDLNAFVQAYDRAVEGCNSCHAASKGGGISLKGVKVTRPTAPVFTNIDYSGN